VAKVFWGAYAASTSHNNLGGGEVGAVTSFLRVMDVTRTERAVPPRGISTSSISTKGLLGLCFAVRQEPQTTRIAEYHNGVGPVDGGVAHPVGIQKWSG